MAEFRNIYHTAPYSDSAVKAVKDALDTLNREIDNAQAIESLSSMESASAMVGVREHYAEVADYFRIFSKM